MTSNAREGGRILGSLGSAEGKGIVRMEDRFDTDIDNVWSALTDPSRLASGTARSRATCASAVSTAYAFSPADGKAPGAWKRASPRSGCGTQQEPGRAGRARHRGQLTADGDQTIVVWEERGMPLDLLSAYGAGVQLHVEDLADHLAGREPVDDAKARWDELHPAYQGLAANLS